MPGRLLLLAAFVAGAGSSPRVQPSFRARVDLVAVAASVVDSTGHVVSGLTVDDFIVYEDDVRRPISQLAAERVPVSIGIALDVSQSMRGERFKDTCNAIGQLLGTLTAEDEVFLLTFSDAPQLVVAWTHEVAAILRALETIEPSGNTALFSGVTKALPVLADGKNPKKALLLVSDGNDRELDPTRRRLTQDEMALESFRRFAFARSEIRKSEALVYAIGIGSSNGIKNQRSYDALDMSRLRELADPTGGYAEEISSNADIAGAVRRMSDDLRMRYLIGFEPRQPADGKFHRLRIATSAGHRVRAKAGYLAAVRRRVL